MTVERKYSEAETEVLRAFWDQQFDEEREQVQEQDAVAQEVAKRSFVSTSQGRGRPPRRAREVNLVGRNQYEYFPKADGSIAKLRITRFQAMNEEGVHPQSDVVAHQILEGTLLPHEDPHTIYLARLQELPSNHNPVGGVHPWSKVKKRLTS